MKIIIIVNVQLLTKIERQPESSNMLRRSPKSYPEDINVDTFCRKNMDNNAELHIEYFLHTRLFVDKVCC